MASRPSLIITQGVIKPITAADSLLVGTGVKSTSGDLTLDAAGSNITIATGKTLGVASGGQIDLPLQYKINGSAVSTNVTAAAMSTLTGGGNADAYHTHTISAANGIQSVANVTALQALSVTGFQDGYLVYVQSFLDYFEYRSSTSGLTADSITISTTSAGGTTRFVRKCLSNIGWQIQSAWFINGSTGNDENNGTASGTPLKTWAEFLRRIGNPIRILQATTVTIQANPPTDTLSLSAASNNGTSGPVLTIVGTPSTVATVTLTSATAPVPSTNTTSAIAWSGAIALVPTADLAFPTTGSAANLYFPVGAGSTTSAKLSAGIVAGTGSVSVQHPTTGDTVVFRSFPSIYTGTIFGSGRIVFQELQITESLSATGGKTSTTIDSCIFRACTLGSNATSADVPVFTLTNSELYGSTTQGLVIGEECTVTACALHTSSGGTKTVLRNTLLIQNQTSFSSVLIRGSNQNCTSAWMDTSQQLLVDATSNIRFNGSNALFGPNGTITLRPMSTIYLSSTSTATGNISTLFPSGQQLAIPSIFTGMNAAASNCFTIGTAATGASGATFSGNALHVPSGARIALQ
jgi:hypothetical protein